MAVFMFNNPSLDDQQRAWDERRREDQRRVAMEEKVDEDTARRSADIAREHPHIPPGLNYALAALDPDPETLATIAVDVAQKAATYVRENQEERNLAQRVTDPLFDARDKGYEAVTGLAEATGVQRSTDAFFDLRDLGFRTARNSVRNFIFGVGSGLEETRRVAHSFIAATDETFDGFDATEISAPNLDTGRPAEFVRSFRKNLAKTEQSAAARALQGESVDIGTGFMPRDEEYRKGLESLKLQDGQVAEFGNFILNQQDFIEPGTWGHRVARGIINTTADIAMDPALALDRPFRLATAAKASAAAPVATKFDDMTRFQRAARLGMLEQSNGLLPKHTLLPETFVDDYLFGHREGQWFRQWLKETDDFEEIRGRLEDVRLSRQLADATEQSEVDSILKRNWARSEGLSDRVRAPLTYRARRASTTLENLIDHTGRKVDEVRDTWLGDFFRLDRGKRIGDWMLTRNIQLDDPNLAVEQFRRAMVNAKLPKDKIHQRSREFADALLDQTHTDARRVYNDFVGDVREDLLGRGWDDDIVRQVTNKMKYDEPGQPMNVGNRAYQIQLIEDAVGPRGTGHVPFVGGIVDGNGLNLPTPMATAEHADDVIEVRQMQEVRRMTGTLSRLARIPAAQKVLKPQGVSAWTGVDAFWEGQKNIWTPMQLISRVAWPMRIAGEEQARMWMDGMHSMFNRPMSYWAYALGLKGNKSILDNPITGYDKFNMAMVERMSGIIGNAPGSVKHRNWAPFVKSNTEQGRFINLWKTELGIQMKSNEFVRVAQAMLDPEQSLDDALEWFVNSDEVQMLGRQSPEKAVYVDDAAARAAGFDDHVDASRAFLQDVEDRIRRMTGEDQELVEAIAHRRLRDMSFDPDDIQALDGDVLGQMDDVMGSVLAEKFDDLAPDVLPGPLDAGESALEDGFRRALDQGQSWLWRNLGAMPSNKANRQPMYMQSYWQKMEELMPWMDDTTKRKALKQADDWLTEYDWGGLEGIVGRLRTVGETELRTLADEVAADAPLRSLGMVDRSLKEVSSEVFETLREMIGFKAHDSIKKRLQSAARQTDAAVGRDQSRLIHSLEEADKIAHTHALRHNENLLYALHKRGHFAEAMRLVFPFAEAWKEVAGAWLKGLAKNPMMLQKANIVHDNFTDSGLFFNDPQSGMEMYAFPFSNETLTKIFFNEHAMSDRQNALNRIMASPQSPIESVNLMAGTAMPGFGPVAQFLSKGNIPEDPDWDGIREQVFPFGEPESVGDWILPAYAQKLREAFAQPDARLFNSTKADSMDALTWAFPDKYEPGPNDGANEVRRKRQLLLDDASELAKKVLLFRGATQFFWLSGPQVEFNFRTDDAEEVKRKVAKSLIGDTEEADLKGLGADLPDFLAQSVLTGYLWHKVDENDGDYPKALRAFTQDLGFEFDDHMQFLSLLMQGKYRAAAQHSTSEAGSKAERANPEVAERYDQVVGYVAPEPDLFDAPFREFTKQIQEGDVVSLTGEEYYDLASEGMAWIIKNHLDSKVAGRNDPNAKEFRQGVSAWLNQRFPGWRDDIPGLPQQANPELQLKQLDRLASDPDVPDWEAVEGLRFYMDKYNQVIENIMEERGFKDRNSAVNSLKSADMHNSRRAWLRRAADEAMDRHPEFSVVYERVLRQFVEPTGPEEEE